MSQIRLPSKGQHIHLLRDDHRNINTKNLHIRNDLVISVKGQVMPFLLGVTFIQSIHQHLLEYSRMITSKCTQRLNLDQRRTTVSLMMSLSCHVRLNHYHLVMNLLVGLVYTNCQLTMHFVGMQKNKTVCKRSRLTFVTKASIDDIHGFKLTSRK